MREAVAQLGPFDLLDPIGAGGMGQVWLGTHRDQGGSFAIKVLDASSAAEPRTRAAFLNEIRAVAGLDHPHIVEVLDYGEVSDAAAGSSGGRLAPGTPYLVMERVRGGTLAPRHVRSWASLRAVLLALLDALAHAHAHGIIHRDIKPSNVLVGGDVLKLADFGLGFAVSGRHLPNRYQLSSGTPSFMPPEQIEGRWRDHGPWTDLYALGCVAWMMVGGRPPFRARTPRETLAKHLVAPVPALRPLLPVPDGFEAWVRTLLAKDPAERFRRAADAAWALDRLASAPEVEGGPSAPEEAPDVVEVHRTALDWGATAARAASPAGRRPAGHAPPLPRSWRRGVRPERSWLRGVGLGLYGLRAIPMADREAERDRLWHELSLVVEEGRARFVLLQGGAGYGKTRLAEWLATRAHELGAAQVLRLHRDSGGLAGALEGELRCTGLDLGKMEDRVATLLPELAPEDRGALARLVRYEADPASTSRSRAERRVVLHRVLSVLAARRPVVVVLDDVHENADELGFVDYLLRNQRWRPAPVLVVATARGELAPGCAAEGWLAKVLGRRGASRTDVGALPQTHRPAFLRNLLGLSGALAAEVDERTAGNPMFAVELVGHWVQRGLLEATPAGFALQAGVAVSLPAGLSSLWRERVESFLAGRDGRALELAAVLGTEVEVEEWLEAAAIAQLSLPGWLVDDLGRAGLIRARGPRFRFAHAMLASALHDRAREAGRLVGHHRAAAEALEGRGLNGERVGRHRLSAEQPELAIQALYRGARARGRREEWAAAEALLALRDRALAASGAGEGDRAWGIGWVTRARNASMRGDFAEAEAWALRAERAGRIHGRDWDVPVAEALRERGRLANYRGDRELARALMDEAERRADALGDRSLRGEVRMDVGNLLVNSGRVPEALGWFTRAREDFLASGNLIGAASCRAGLGRSLRQTGDLGEARQHMLGAIGEYRSLGWRRGVAKVTNNLGDVERLLGHLEDAELRFREARRLYRDLDMAQGVIPAVNLGLVLVERERWAEARAELSECLVDIDRLGRKSLKGLVRIALLCCAAGDGDWRAWDAWWEEGGQLVEDTGYIDVDIATFASRAAAAAARAGRPERARPVADLAIRQYTALGRLHDAQTVRALYP